MEQLDLRFCNFRDPFVNFKTKEYIFPSVLEFITNTEKYKDFTIIDEHIADVVMRCNSHGIKTYYCCSGHPIDIHYDKLLTSPSFCSYIAFERKPIIKHMFDNSKCWDLEIDFVENGSVPAYTIRTNSKCNTFKRWSYAMEELSYKFSHLTNEFKQIIKLEV